MADSPHKRPLPDPDLVRRFARFPVRSRLPMEGGFTGVHRGRHRGAGLEFAEYRRYAPGDDVARLDWRVYGRSDRFYVKESETDSDLVCRVLVDASGSMGYGSEGRTKLAAAIEVGAVLAALLLRQGDAVGLASMGGAPPGVDIPARRGAAHLGVLTAALADLQPGGDGDIAVALSGWAGRLRRRGMVLVFSDSLGDPARLASCLGLLAHRGHDVTLFEVSDPDEEEFPFTGTIRFDDLEGGPAQTIEATAAAAEYRRRRQRHRDVLLAGCMEHGVRLVPLSSGTDPASALAQFVGGTGGAVPPGGPP